jgi:hypothetical protein
LLVEETFETPNEQSQTKCCEDNCSKNCEDLEEASLTGLKSKRIEDEDESYHVSSDSEEIPPIQKPKEGKASTKKRKDVVQKTILRNC